MRITIRLASLIAFSMIAAPADAHSHGNGNAVHGPNDQAIVGGKVVGQDRGSLARLEIWRRTESMGGGWFQSVCAVRLRVSETTKGGGS